MEINDYSELAVADVILKNIKITKAFKKESVIKNINGLQQMNVQIVSENAP